MERKFKCILSGGGSHPNIYVIEIFRQGAQELIEHPIYKFIGNRSLDDQGSEKEPLKFRKFIVESLPPHVREKLQKIKIEFKAQSPEEALRQFIQGRQKRRKRPKFIEEIDIPLSPQNGEQGIKPSEEEGFKLREIIEGKRGRK